MKNRWEKIVCIGLALIMLSLGVTACDIFGGPGGNGGTEVPVVEINRVAPNNLDLAGMTEAALATPGEGAILVNEAARIWVPPGAVANDTPVTIKTFIESPESMTSTVADAPEVTVISNFYDFGPDNTKFKEPVTVTLSYAEEDLPAGANENNIMPIYYDGVNWISMERQLDTENNRVSFETTSFSGLPIVLALGYAVTGTAITATVGVVAYKAYSWWVKDPVYYGKAAEYVTPSDPTVQSWADKAQINLTNSNPPHPVYVKDVFSDPETLKEFVSSGEGFIQFENKASAYAAPIKPVYAKSWNPDDWQKPADYFKNGMVGDCKNVANAMASIFRHYGYTAKCADGYMVNDDGKTVRHGWLEVIIDGKPYYVGSHAEIMPFEDAVKQYTLTRPKGKDGERFYWDESGQKPYKDNWWVDKLQVTVNNKLAFPGGQIGVEVGAGPGVAMDIKLTLENPQKVNIAQKNGATDAATGKVSFTLDLPVNAPVGIYWVIATDATGEISEPMPVGVDALKISGVLKSSKVEPGEMLEINARFNKPLSAAIWVDSKAMWTTDADGFVDIVKTITPDTPLGPYTLTLSAPDYNTSTQIKYAVWLPATLKVNITPETVAPGGSFTVNVLIAPAQIARITMQGYSGEWMTGPDGAAHIKMNVSQTAVPGKYEVVVKAPELNISASDTYTVQSALGPEIGLADVTAIAAQMTINAEGEDEDSYFEMQLFLGGQFVRTSGVKGYEIFASGTVDAGEMYYSFTLNKELTTVTSGVISLVAGTGEFFEVRFSNVPMDPDYEATFYEDQGVNALIFRVKGTEVSSHLGSIKVNEPSVGTFNRFFAVADSEIVIILAAATESQLTGLLDE